ncbi:Cytochrome P450 [Amanita muscaria]
MNALATLLIALTVAYLPVLGKAIINHQKLRSIPTVGPSGFLTSYIGAFRFLRHAKEVVQEGYDKYRGSVFKVPMMTKWMIVVSGPALVEDIRCASADVFSMQQAIRETLHTDLTVDPDIHDDLSHVDVVKHPLTRNIAAKLADVQDEIAAAFADHIPVQDTEWTKLNAFSTIQDIICRASNRMLVGLPLCRDPDYLSPNKHFAFNISKASRIINMFPFFLRSTVARLLPSVRRDIERGTKHLGPLIQQRIQQDAENGKDWSHRPNDVISWLLDVTDGQQRSLRNLAIRVLFINFASIDSTTTNFTFVLYELATRPEYVQPMREEVEAIVREEGWSKESISKLHKLDSFIKEAMRLSPFGSFGMMRKALKDFKLSDGTVVPAGSLLTIPLLAMHTDANTYPDPDTFDGFRFDKLREQEADNAKHQLVSLDSSYFAFGHGRHACPGRFFVAYELKMMLAHVLLNYDVKMANGNGRPANWWFGYNCLPDLSAQVLFRKRV